MDFEVLIDDLFVNLVSDAPLNPIHNKNVLSLLNDYEDGQWQYLKFQRFIWDNIAETSLSHKERANLIGNPQSLLAECAKNLRLTDSEADIGKGSELAEIVLYGVMKNHFRALSVVPKIFYKQNPQDNAKGADSVHLVLIENESDFSIWFGEAKFYNSIEDARLKSIVESVGKSLTTEKLRKENSIITNLSDIQHLPISADLKQKILDALSNKRSMDHLRPKINIPILLLHECSITAKHKASDEAYKKEIREYHLDRATTYFRKQIEELGAMVSYSSMKFHVILIPVPNKATIVDKFVQNVEFYKGQ
ncbi:DUF1837 domain-containing protein [Herbaspirillum robiniae]|uniref:HamA C-terminal domain-containing protein n=1 Tax=Herbaspirillum robiniae TaxID=2014887 RepID=UPI0009A151B2|nr:DUF1837 domain-containing protein [Herbaspirillum robiniae]